MKASSTAIQATKANPAPKTMSAPYRMLRPAATEAIVIGTATITSSARPARNKLPNGSRASMMSPKEIPPPRRPTTPAYPERATAPVMTAAVTRTNLPTPAGLIRSVFPVRSPLVGSEGPASAGPMARPAAGGCKAAWQVEVPLMRKAMTTKAFLGSLVGSAGAAVLFLAAGGLALRNDSAVTASVADRPTEMTCRPGGCAGLPSGEGILHEHRRGHSQE